MITKIKIDDPNAHIHRGEVLKEVKIYLHMGIFCI